MLIGGVFMYADLLCSPELKQHDGQFHNEKIFFWPEKFTATSQTCILSDVKKLPRRRFDDVSTAFKGISNDEEDHFACLTITAVSVSHRVAKLN